MNGQNRGVNPNQIILAFSFKYHVEPFIVLALPMLATYVIYRLWRKKLNPDLKAKLEQAEEHYEAMVQVEKHRATFLLASMIIDTDDPEQSIAELERIGEQRLREIVKWLEEFKQS